jgi:hypothetical protein
MFQLLFEAVFALIIIAAVWAYFRRRKQKLDRMGLRDKIEDMFSDIE